MVQKVADNFLQLFLLFYWYTGVIIDLHGLVMYDTDI